MEHPKHQIRARHTDTTLTVHQAYRPETGLPAAWRWSGRQVGQKFCSGGVLLLLGEQSGS
ncbi:hypothetical protein a10_08178 [Streptomyces acidiscabies]|nr:hypothetical protein a10_08178 [Streptomyces acidiscabies]GAV37895.1 hypothetical protein Saa2_00769 [Streptomyces acidiscabies]